MDEFQTVKGGNQPLPLRKREDLQVVSQMHGKRQYWAIKDGIAGRFYLLREEEFTIFQLLDGQHSVKDIVEEYSRRFAPRHLTPSRCQEFLAQLHRNGLVLSAATGQGTVLHDRAERSRKQRRVAAFMNLLAIRWRGMNPDPFLTWLHGRLRWLFSPLILVLSLLGVVAAGLSVALRFDAFQGRWPDFYEFFAIHNAGWLLVVLVTVKLLHELAHGLVCKHFGGECPEFGILFVAFVPCLYCDVSDSWMMPNRWHRIAVASAGMCVELVLAAGATFLWWVTVPGPLHAICRNVMIVCSATTLLINLNPLMRFDGYFILSDLLGVPNLHARSRAVLQRWWMRWGLGVGMVETRALPDRKQAWFALFALASTVYRWSVVAAIVWLVSDVLTYHRVGFVVPVLVGLFLGGMVIPSMARMWASLAAPGRRRPQPINVCVTGVILMFIVTTCCFLPVPFSVKTSALIRARHAQIVYATAPGTLIDSVSLGAKVKEGQPLVRLENHQVRLLIHQAQGDLQQQQLHVNNLKARRVFDRLAKRELPSAEDELEDLTARLATLRREQQRLTLQAPRDGVVLPVPRRSPLDGNREWMGSPLERMNRNSFIQSETALCMIGDDRREAILAIEQASIDLVRVGQEVQIHLGANTVLRGFIRDIAERGVRLDSKDLLSDAQLGRRVVDTESHLPTHSLHEACVELSGSHGNLAVGLRGRAKIHVASRTLYEMVGHYFFHTFRRAS